MPENAESTENTKPCAYCGSPIIAEAILCPVCKSYKSAWRTTVVYVAGIAGLLGFIGSADVFIISTLPNMYKIVAWKDQVKIWHFEAGFHPHFGVTISNIGDGPVIVSSILLFYKNANAQYNIGKTLNSNESFSLSMPDEPVGNYDNYIKNGSGNPPNIARERSTIVTVENVGSGSCFMMKPFNAEAEAISRMNDAYSHEKMKLVTEPIDAFVVYYSLHSKKEVRDSFPAVTTFVRSTKPECRALNSPDLPPQ